MITTAKREWLLSLDSDEVSEAYEILKDRSRMLALRAKANFRSGDRVFFDSKKHGRVRGTVIKTMRKNVRMRAENGVTWTVGPTLLRMDAE